MVEKEQNFSADDAEFAAILAQSQGWEDSAPSHPTGGEDAPVPPAAPPRERRPRRERTSAGDAQHQTGTTEQKAQAETDRGKWVGYIGRYAPQFDKLPSGRLRGQFWLGEHSDPNELDKAIWHRVYCLDRHAESLRKQALARGMLIEVTGTLQASEKPQPDGTMKRTESIYCFGVRVMGGGVKPVRP